MDASQKQKTSHFQNAIAVVEALSTEDQALLIEIIQKRLQQQKRHQLKQEITEIRQEYKKGEITFGSAEDFMDELETFGVY